MRILENTCFLHFPKEKVVMQATKVGCFGFM